MDTCLLLQGLSATPLRLGNSAVESGIELPSSEVWLSERYSFSIGGP